MLHDSLHLKETHCIFSKNSFCVTKQPILTIITYVKKLGDKTIHVGKENSFKKKKKKIYPKNECI